MIDHYGFSATDLGASKAFYLAALAPLGVGAVMEYADGEEAGVGFGEGDHPYFWVGSGGVPGPHFHLAFAAASRAAVDEFYRAAIAAGGRDNGGPGLRPDYHANDYAAFVFDPDGHNIEAVCHKPE